MRDDDIIQNNDEIQRVNSIVTSQKEYIQNIDLKFMEVN